VARKEEPLQMRIGEAKQRDIGKKRARIGPNAMDYLKAAPGDVIEINAKRSTCAIVWPSDEDDKFPDVVKIDGQTRKNIGGVLNDIVKIKKVITKAAKLLRFLFQLAHPLELKAVRQLFSQHHHTLLLVLVQ